MKTAIDAHIEAGGRALPRTLTQAHVLADYYGIREMPDFAQLPDEERLSILNQVIRELRKIPRGIRETISSADRGLDLVLDNVTNHPQLRNLRGKVVAKWENGRTYDVCRGLATGRSIVAGDQLGDSGSVNLILHEHGHTWERALQDMGRTEIPISSTLGFRDAHVATWWKAEERYFSANADEAFAEAFAKYLHSPTSRFKLQLEQPKIYEFIRDLIQDEEIWATISRPVDPTATTPARRRLEAWVKSLSNPIDPDFKWNEYEAMIARWQELLAPRLDEMVQVGPEQLRALLWNKKFENSMLDSLVVVERTVDRAPTFEVGRITGRFGEILLLKEESWNGPGSAVNPSDPPTALYLERHLFLR